MFLLNHIHGPIKVKYVFTQPYSWTHQGEICFFSTIYMDPSRWNVFTQAYSCTHQGKICFYSIIFPPGPIFRKYRAGWEENFKNNKWSNISTHLPSHLKILALLHHTSAFDNFLNWYSRMIHFWAMFWLKCYLFDIEHLLCKCESSHI